MLTERTTTLFVSIFYFQKCQTREYIFASAHVYGITRLKRPVKYTIKLSSAFYLYFLRIKKRLNVMISFNLFNILHVNVTIIYILWISVFFILSARIRWPGSSGWPDCAGPHADGEAASYGQRLFWHWPGNWRR